MQRRSELSVWYGELWPFELRYTVERTGVRVHEHEHIRLAAGMDDIGHSILLKLPYVA